MAARFENPMGTDGFEFLEFATQEPEKLRTDFERFGFIPVACHRSKNITLYRQNDINFILNLEPSSHAENFAKQHGASACGMGFRVKDADSAFKRAVSLGAKPVANWQTSPIGLNKPAIYGVGGSLIYFIDDYDQPSLYANEFVFENDPLQKPKGVGLTYLDHVTHNVQRGEMDNLANFYQTVFNFREIRYFDIKGQKTGLVSRAMTSPCGKIRIPINESSDEQSQIAEFIREFKGEGIQHIALGVDNIYQSVESLRANGIKFLKTPDTYYKMLPDRISWHQENLELMQKNRILMDGGPEVSDGILLQIFTVNMLGPVFFEIIQRKGNEGFGEGNFKALFEAIERDQIERGVL